MAFVILGLLMTCGPQTLYSLNQRFEADISLFYSASLGSLQKALKSLGERDALTWVEQVEGGRNKKVYRITESGRAEFLAWLATPVAVKDSEATMLARLYFLGSLPDEAQRIVVVESIRHRAEAAEQALLAVRERVSSFPIRESATDQRQDAYRLLTLDYGLSTYAAARAWCDAIAQAPDASAARALNP